MLMDCPCICACMKTNKKLWHINFNRLFFRIQIDICNLDDDKTKLNNAMLIHHENIKCIVASFIWTYKLYNLKGSLK